MTVCDNGMAARRSGAARAAVSRALAAGDRVKQDMDVLRASQGRVSADDSRGTAARPHERPARRAGRDRAAALTERRAIPGRQGTAAIRSSERNVIPVGFSVPRTWEKNHKKAPGVATRGLHCLMR